MKLKSIKNGKVLTIGSIVSYFGDKCSIYLMDTKNDNIGLERLCDGVSWERIRAKEINAKWDE